MDGGREGGREGREGLAIFFLPSDPPHPPPLLSPFTSFLLPFSLSYSLPFTHPLTSHFFPPSLPPSLPPSTPRREARYFLGRSKRRERPRGEETTIGREGGNRKSDFDTDLKFYICFIIYDILNTTVF